MAAHEPTICTRDTRGTQYVGKGYRSEFTCPVCSRSCWQHMSFLGSRHVVCNGSKFTKVSKAEWAEQAVICELCGKPAILGTACLGNIEHDGVD